MIIGLSGKIGSGKDTVGKIIQVLCFLETIKVPYTYANFDYNMRKNFFGDKYYGDWQIKKFAKKLKEMVVLLTGCSLENLEDQVFKGRELPECWRKFGGDYLTSGDKVLIHRVIDLGASPKKYELNDTDKIYFEEELGKHRLYRDSELILINEILEQKGFLPTYRWLLQQLGTEAIRNEIHENAWVNALFANYDYNTERVSVSFKDGAQTKTTKMDAYVYPKWLITDMRFPNEMKAIQERKGLTLRINRWDLSRGTIQQQKEWAKVNAHPSETALDDATFDYTIENDGTIQDLVEKVRIILLDAKILNVA